MYFVFVIFTILYTSSRSKLRLHYVSSKEFGSDEHTIISSRTRQRHARRACPAYVDAKVANPVAPSDCRMATIPPAGTLPPIWSHKAPIPAPIPPAPKASAANIAGIPTTTPIVAHSGGDVLNPDESSESV